MSEPIPVNWLIASTDNVCQQQYRIKKTRKLAMLLSAPMSGGTGLKGYLSVTIAVCDDWRDGKGRFLPNKES